MAVPADVRLEPELPAPQAIEPPPLELCAALPAVGSVALLAEDNVLATEAVNAYLRKANPAPTVAERICSVNNDFGRIYTAYDELYGAVGGTGLGEGLSIVAAGTMVQTPEGCWILLPDGGSGPYRLDPLPRGFMRMGQRVELTLSGPLDFAGLDDCPFPQVTASAARPGNWDVQATDSVLGLEPLVRAELVELGTAATVSVDGTLLAVTGLNRGQLWPLEEALRGRFGMFMLVGDGSTVHIWPPAGQTISIDSP